MADNRQDYVTCWNPSKKEEENTHNAGPVSFRITKIELESGKQGGFRETLFNEVGVEEGKNN
jgi:hypothetical protein